MAKGNWPNRHITFIVAEKAYFTVLLDLFSVHAGGGVGRKRYMGEGLAENVIWRAGGIKLLKKPSYDI